VAWRFHKSIKILPGIRLNVGKKGISSLSVGPRGAKLNIGNKGTRLTTSIPGTGISHTTQLTKRLDKSVGNTMTECPFCGHRMRKQWSACPTCKNSLIQVVEPPKNNESTIIDAEARFIDDKKPIAPPPTKKAGYLGCLAIIFIFFLIGSCLFGGNKKDSPPPTPAATSSTQAKTVVPPVEPKQAATTAPTVQQAPQQTAQEPPQQQPTEKQYTGAGPNGEGIKGHIDSKKGTMIYHLPGDRYYSRTKNISKWFFTEKEAQAAGYRHILK
jgi:hypothetical protein